MPKLSPRGRALTAACFVAGGSLLTGAPHGAEGAGWASMLLATVGGAAVCVALGLLGKRAPDLDFFAAVDGAIGRSAGGIAAILLGAAAFAMLMRDLAVITQFVGANMIAKTPRPLIALMIALIAAWCASTGRSTVGRWVELAAAVAGGTLVLSLLLASGGFSAAEAARGLMLGAGDVPHGAVGCFAGSAGAVIFAAAAFFPFGKDERRRALPMVAGVATGGALLAAVMLFNVALLGADTVDLFNFPTYHALRISGLSGVLERMEALLMIPAVATSFVRIAVELTFLMGAVERLLPSLAGRRSHAFVIAAMAVTASLLLLPNQPALASAESALSGWCAAAIAAVAAAVGASALIRR